MGFRLWVACLLFKARSTIPSELNLQADSPAGESEDEGCCGYGK